MNVTIFGRLYSVTENRRPGLQVAEKGSVRAIGSLLVLLTLFAVAGPPPATAQQEEVPEAVEEELSRQGMTAEEARRRAEQLGIDLSDPERAVRQARRQGVPEARIQALLQAARQSEETDSPSSAPRSARPVTLAGQATVEPDTLRPSRLPRRVTVRVPLASDAPISAVQPFFVRGDTLRPETVRLARRTEGGGEWTAQFTTPDSLESGRYALRVRATSEDADTELSTNQSLLVQSEEDRAERSPRDSLRYFGYDTFRNVPDAFQPSSTGPVDDGYVVGPQDELRLTVWGGAEFTYDLQVDREGRVVVPNVGQFTVAGKQLEALRVDMKQWLSRSYSGLTADPPTVYMDLSITRLRPLKVFALGEVEQPGGYTVSATSNAFNALYSLGGPLRRGSLRKIQVFRDGEPTATLDLYNYLIEGRQFDPVGLQSGDYIRVPTRGKTVSITGAVQRPAYYEMTEGETVQDLIEYAGGLEADAYMPTFRVSRLVPPAERDDENASVPRQDLNFSLDAVMNGETTVELADADQVHVQVIPEREDPASASQIESAQVSGAVLQPGRYTIGDSVRTVRDLIRRANGLTDAAYREQATLIRIDEDLGEAVRSLNVDSAMAGVPRADIPLVPGDSLHVSSVQNLEGRRTVRITGQVRDPGTYAYRTDMTVADLLLRGGGLADSTYRTQVLLSRADLFREADDGRSERVIPFNLSRALSGSGRAETPLKPGDEIRIYPLRAEVNQNKFVEISGAVKDPGQFRYQENLMVDDLILRANGFEEDVYLDEIEIARPREGEQGMKTLRVPLSGSTTEPEAIRFNADDTTQALQAVADVRLQHRDRVIVRTDPTFSERRFVSVQGAVAFPGDYALNGATEQLSSVLERAGGILPRGYPGGGQLIRDGEQFVLDFREAMRGADDVNLEQGDRITIPSQPNSVSVRGNVVEEGLIKYKEGQGVDYYLDQAGGVRDSTKNIFVTQATGATIKVTSGWFQRSPEVEDGAVIRVSRETPREEPIDYAEVASNVTQVVSSTLTVLVLVTRVFN